MVGISEYEYNLALFEVGSEVMEERYGVEVSNVILKKKSVWSWLKIQQRCVDMEASRVIVERELEGVAAVELYREELKNHLEGVYFNRRLKKQMLW